MLLSLLWHHGDVTKWKHFPRYWPFVRGIHRSPVNSPHKGQWRGALMFSLICVWINGWVNNREAGDWRRYRAHCDVIVMTVLEYCFVMLASWHSNTIHITGMLWGEWVNGMQVESPHKGPVMQIFDVSLLLGEQAVQQLVEFSVIWDAALR